MKRFLLGVLVASLAWGGLFLAQAAGVIDLLGARGDETGVADAGPAEPAAIAEAASDEPGARKKKRRPGKRRRPGGAAYAAGEGASGDDVGEVASRELAIGETGGEQQLSAAQIDRGIDTVWNGIQRCLVLVPADLPATGKVVLGMHIAPSGAVNRVGLTGPNPLVQGECGACIRRSVQSIRFPSFDGPEMVARYPIVFE